MVAKYFAGLDGATLKKDMKVLPEIKKYATRTKFDLSKEMIGIWKKARKVLAEESGKVSDPHQMGIILAHILLQSTGCK